MARRLRRELVEETADAMCRSRRAVPGTVHDVGGLAGRSRDVEDQERHDDARDHELHYASYECTGRAKTTRLSISSYRAKRARQRSRAAVPEELR